MANKDLQNQLNQLERSLNNSKVNTDAFRKAINEAGDDTEKLTQLVDRMVNALNEVDDTATSLATQLDAIGKEFDQQLSSLNRTKGAFRKIINAADELRNDEQGITDLTKSQVIKLQEKLVKNKAVLKSQKDSLKADIQSGKLSDDKKEEAEALLATTMDESKALENTQKKARERLELEGKINKQMGVAGALIGGAGTLMERLGMSSGIFQESVQDAMNDMRELSKATADSNSFMNKLSVAGTGFKRILQGLGDAMADPTSIGKLLLDTMIKINEQSVEIRRLTGQMGASFDTSAGSAASMVDGMEVVAELTKQTGLSAQNAFSKENIVGAANLKVEMGLASEQAGSLAIMAETSTQNVNELTDSVVGTTNEFNGANRTALAHGVILRDVADASEGIRASFAGNVDELTKGAAAARRLGMNIGELDQIASSLLDFESSIGNELEAQLLTGKNINLGKARELALNNDLAGLGEELFKNSASLAEFGKMNRIQQEAQAKAVGMTRDQLAKVAYQRAVNLQLSDEEIKNATGIEAADMRRAKAVDNFQKSLEKIAAALAPVMERIADVLSMPFVPQLVLGGVAAGKLLSKVKGIAQGMLSFGSSIMKAVKNFDILNAKQTIFGKMYKGGQFMKGGGQAKAGGQRAGGLFSKVLGKGNKKASDTAKSAADKVSDASKSTKGVKPGAGEGIKGFLKGLGDGLASIGKQIGDVVKGALALGVAGLALGGSFALALKMVKDVDPVQMLAFAGSLSMLGLTLALLGKVGGQIIQGALAMGILGLSLIPAAYGFSLLKDVDPGQMFAFAGALTLLGLAAAGLGFLSPFIAAGAVAIALLGASLLPVAFAFNVLADSPIESIITKLSGLATITPQLYLLGGALMSIAAGLGAIAISGIAAIPALAALGTLAVLSTPLLALGGLFGDDNDGEDNSEMITILKEIRDQVKQGGDVYLDGNKVGEALVLGSYISS